MHITARLYELIAALDRRTPRPHAADEPRIAREANELRVEAIEQLQRIERGEHSVWTPDTTRSTSPSDEPTTNHKCLESRETCTPSGSGR